MRTARSRSITKMNLRVLTKESNWVPAPKDEFSLYIRAYWPKAEILDGRWVPPAVTRVDGSGTVGGR